MVADHLTSQQSLFRDIALEGGSMAEDIFLASLSGDTYCEDSSEDAVVFWHLFVDGVGPSRTPREIRYAYGALRQMELRGEDPNDDFPAEELGGSAAHS